MMCQDTKSLQIMYDNGVESTKDIVKSTRNSTFSVESCRLVQMCRIRTLYQTVELVHCSIKILLLGQHILIKKGIYKFTTKSVNSIHDM